MENMRIPELKALARECLRGYSQLRKAELIAFLQDNEHQAQRPPPPPRQRHARVLDGPRTLPPVPAPQMSPSGAPPRGATWETNRPPQMSTWEPQREPQTEVRQPESEAPLMKRQLKHRKIRDSKLAKKFVSLNTEISNLKSQIGTLEDKIMRASESTNARFKRKKIRSMKREADKIAEKLREYEKALRALKPRFPKDPISRSQSRGFAPTPFKLHFLNRNKHVEAKIAEMNMKMRRAKKNKIRPALIAKRDKLKEELDFELNWGPIQLQRAFNNGHRSYRIAGYQGINLNTFFTMIRKMLVDLIRKETIRETVRTQATTWIRFSKGSEKIDLAFNSRMLAANGLKDIDELVNRMISHTLEQIENPALRDSGFVFDEVVRTNVDFHRLNLTRGSSYLPLPEWISRKKAIINPQNLNMECFKWAIIGRISGKKSVNTWKE